MSRYPGKMAETRWDSVKMILFSQKRGLTYRIPALIYWPVENLFLAFAEERSSPRDEHAKGLVMRRGYKEGLSVKWGPSMRLETAGMPNHRTMNPCPVYDKKNGVIFLFFICVKDGISEQHQLRTRRSAVRLGYISTHNGGHTWSSTTDLTEQVTGDGEVKKWATFAVGPGHGLQLSSGRLVIPAYAYYVHKVRLGFSFPWWTQPHCFSFYSDDGGRTWARGELLKSLKTTECQMAQVTCQDNRQVLYCNARSLHKFRAEAYSGDNGGQFPTHALSKRLCELPFGCQGSVVSFFPSDPGPKEDPNGSTLRAGESPSSASPERPSSWLMFSHPTSRKKRRDLGIYLNPSPLDQSRWTSPWVLNQGPSGYSDLAVCEDGEPLAFGCLFECGESKEYEDIAFRLFSHEELLRNVKM
ncbi:sialidase-3-like [Thamnophis elegans]|uniref:sialidase-3-like n=1 Tax=Thamnophis elegans TaxID=35005 RepID=UPI00137874BA|nr:sialidase-3-like [Thamnophis elegans]